MGAIPNKLPGFQDIERDDEARARFEAAWDTTIRPTYGWHLTQMFHGMERGELRSLYVIGENPAQSEADINKTRELLEGLDFLIVQDIVRTKTAEYADVVFPSLGLVVRGRGDRHELASAACSACARRSRPPGEARDDTWIIARARTQARVTTGATRRPSRSGTSCARSRRCTPACATTGSRRMGGIQWPCPDEQHPGSPILHERLWAEPRRRARRRRSRSSRTRPPFESLDDEYPIRLTTGRRLESYNTGAQTNLYNSPLHRGESLRPLARGRRAAVRSRRARSCGSRRRRGSVEAPRAHRPLAASRARVHDVPFPGRGRHQPADDRCDGSEVGHGGVQGRRDPGREDPSVPAPASSCRRGRSWRRTASAWISSCSTPSRPRSSALRSTTCSARRRTRWEGGERSPGEDGHTARTAATTRARAPAPAAAGAAGAAGARRLDQPGRPQLRLQAPRRAARRRLRRRDVLRAARRRAAPAARRARLRGPRLPLPRLGGADRAARGARRAGGRAIRRRRRPGSAARASASATGRPPRCSRSRATTPQRAGARADRGRATCSRSSPATTPAGAPRRRASAGRATRACACCAASAASSPTSLDDYRAHGGYAALRRALEIGPDAVIREVKDSKLLGRGGAAFPTGVKWEAVARQPARPHYLICNADESEPGTFKDRVIMEGDPFAADRGDDDRRLRDRLRAGLHLPARRVSARAPRARQRSPRRGAAGSSATTSSARDSRSTSRSARARGAYICGEETAIFNSIEGQRGEPRNKPPFPVVSGLFGKPTVVNNVETLVNVLDVVLERRPAVRRDRHRGVDRHEALLPLAGTSSARASTRCRSARRCASCSSWPAASPAGARCRRCCSAAPPAASCGRTSSICALTFEGARAAKTTLGSGVVMVIDDTVDLPRMLMRIAAFFRNESCGQCVPCRVGTVRQQEALARLVSGRTRGGVGRRAGADRRDRTVHARRVDLRPRPDGVERHRVGRSAGSASSEEPA